MKVMALRDAKQTLSSTVDVAQEERVLITRHGKPAAMVIGVEGRDLEDVLLMSSPRFWEMIEARRQETETLSLEEVRRRLARPNKRPRASKARR